jgi:NADH dehydrogenase [ubiquinone] 1 alpha subcomplex assembly factor 6
VKGETTPPAAGPAMTGAAPGLSAVGALVRQHDPDRYKTALFAPAGRREALFALYAFNYEIARVRESVTTLMLGQIRLQWWREVVDAAYAGMPTRQHMVAEPLAAVIRDFGLSRAYFDRMIDARERDLADEPLATLEALEDYAEGTAAALLTLTLEVLDVSQPAARTAVHEVGIGYALAGLLRAMPSHARAGRRYIPEDIAANAGLDPSDYAGLRISPALCRAVAAIADAAAEHLRAARRGRPGVSRAALPALLPAIVADRALSRLRRAGWNPFDPSVAAPDPLLTWRLAGATLLGRF